MENFIREQLRDFHISGRGLDELTPEWDPQMAAAGHALPEQDASYPVWIAEDYSAHPGMAWKGKGWLAGFERGSAETLAAAALLEAQGDARDRHLEMLRRTAERLQDLLTLDDSHEEESQAGGRLGSALGARAGSYFNADVLAGAIRRRPKPVQRMSPERRERCEGALAGLRTAAAAAAGHPRFVVFRAQRESACPLGGEVRLAKDPFAAALEYCRGLLVEAEPALRDLRLGRLEVDAAYEPNVHGPALKRFRWETATADEIEALPRVLVSVSAAEARQCTVGSLTELLSSGYPLHVVITHPLLTEEDLQGSVPEFAAMAVAQRDSFVLQGSLGRVDHLLIGLREMARSERPGLAVVATPGEGGWVEASIAAGSSAWPLYRYDPGQSYLMHEALRLEPLPANGWTPAHAASANPRLQHHFRILPGDIALPDPMELSMYLELFSRRAPLAIPYLRLSRGTQEIRLAISRGLAGYCHARRRSWKALEDWANGPAVSAVPVNLPSASNEEAMRKGAELAITRVMALLTGQAPGGGDMR